MLCNLCSSNRIYKKFSLREFDVLRCKKCSLVFLSNIPNEEGLKELYSSNYYRDRGEYYFNNIVSNPENGKNNENIEASFSLGLKRLNFLKPERGRLLDVGCGLGIFLAMAKMENWDACGIDISPYAVKYAKERFSLEVYNSSSLKDVAFPPKSFDVITLWDSLEHFPDPLNQFKEIHKVLKDDGLVMLDIPNEKSLLRVMARCLYVMTGRTFTYPVRKLYHNYHLYYFDPHAIEILLNKVGFKMLSIERKNIPIVKARGSSLEKGLVKFLSYLERILGMEYELLILAKKAENTYNQVIGGGNG